MKQSTSFLKLVDAFSRLNGVGPKTAERMAYNVLNMSNSDAKYFADAIIELKQKIHVCPNCGLYTDDDLCEICKDASRDKQTLIVITHPKDVFIFEKSLKISPIYHVLGGNINISKGITIDSLNIERLLKRIEENEVKEVIIATDPTLEGEATALYLKKLLATTGVVVTRLAYGLALGSSIDYTDSLTLEKALEGRREL